MYVITNSCQIQHCFAKHLRVLNVIAVNLNYFVQYIFLSCMISSDSLWINSSQIIISFTLLFLRTVIIHPKNERDSLCSRGKYSTNDMTIYGGPIWGHGFKYHYQFPHMIEMSPPTPPIYKCLISKKYVYEYYHPKWIQIQLYADLHIQGWANIVI